MADLTATTGTNSNNPIAYNPALIDNAVITALDAYFGDTLSSSSATTVSTTGTTSSGNIPIIEYASDVSVPTSEAIATYVAAQTASATYNEQATLVLPSIFLSFIESLQQLAQLFSELQTTQQQATTAQATLSTDATNVNNDATAFNKASSDLQTASKSYNSNLNTLQTTGASLQATINEQLGDVGNAQSDYNIALGNYDNNPDSDNLNALNDATTALNTAETNLQNSQTSYANIVSDYNNSIYGLSSSYYTYSSASQTLQGDVTTFNKDATTYTNFFVQYNSLLAQANDVSYGNTDNATTGQVTVPTINSLSVPGPFNFTPPAVFPDNANPPFTDPSGFPSVNTDWGNEGSVNIGNLPNPPPVPDSTTIFAPLYARSDAIYAYLQQYLKVVGQIVSNYQTISAGQLAALKKNPTTTDSGNSTQAAAASAPAPSGSTTSISALVAGLGSSNLGSILASIINAQTATSTTVDSNPTGKNVTTLAGALMVLSQLAVGNAAQLAQELGLGTIDQNSTLGTLVASLALAAVITQAIVNTLGSATPSTTTPTTTGTPTTGTPTTTSSSQTTPVNQGTTLTPDQINTSLAAASVAGALLATSTYSSTLVDQRLQFSYLAQTEGSQQALTTINSNNPNISAQEEDFLNQTGTYSDYNPDNTTAYINSQFNNNGLPVQLTQTQQTELSSSIIAAAKSGQNIQSVISSQLLADGISKDQIASASQSISSTFNNAILGLILTANVGTQASTSPQVVNGVTVDPALAQIASEYVNNQIIDNLTTQGQTARASTQSSIILNSVAQNLQNLEAVYAQIGSQVKATDKQAYIDQQNNNVVDFFKTSLLLDPVTFGEALLDPSKNFVGLMYAGNRTGFKRGSIDIPLT